MDKKYIKNKDGNVSKNYYGDLGLNKVKSELLVLWKEKEKLEKEVLDFEKDNRGYKSKKFRKLLDRVESGKGDEFDNEDYWRFYSKYYEEEFYYRDIELDERLSELMFLIDKNINFYKDELKIYKNKLDFSYGLIDV